MVLALAYYVNAGNYVSVFIFLCELWIFLEEKCFIYIYMKIKSYFWSSHLYKDNKFYNLVEIFW